MDSEEHVQPALAIVMTEMVQNWAKESVTSCDTRAKISDNVRRRLDTWIGIPGFFIGIVVSDGVGHWSLGPFMIALQLRLGWLTLSTPTRR